MSEYVHKAADTYWGTGTKDKESKESWLEEWLHLLKHKKDGATLMLEELKRLKKLRHGDKAIVIQKAITYISNHLDLMDYCNHVRRRLPIGSGVTETSCKTVVKSRMCVSGAGWSPSGSGVVLTLRTLHLSESTWDSFWSRVMRYGAPGAREFGPSPIRGDTIN